MKIIPMAVGTFMSNCFIVACDKTSDAVIIDPGSEATRIMGEVKKNGFKVSKILATHAHIDHIAAASEVKELSGAPFILHRSEMLFIEGFEQQQRFFMVREGKRPAVDSFVAGGDTVSFGDCALKVVETPGHSPGGICFIASDSRVVFAGDTLFAGSIGRTDLPGGDFEALIRNIRTQLFVLPDETTVYCGHGPETSIGFEKRTNPFLS